MKMYCSECGTPHEYAAKKPNFCSNCGYSFAGLDKAQSSTPNENIETQSDFEEDQGDNFEIPNINGLQVEIEPYGKSGVKIEDAVDYSMGSDLPQEKGKPKKGRKMTKKAQQEFLKNWQKEAGTSRNQNS